MKWQSDKLRQMVTGIDCLLYLPFITYQLDDMQMKSYVSLEVSAVGHSLDIDIQNNMIFISEYSLSRISLLNGLNFKPCGFFDGTFLF